MSNIPKIKECLQKISNYLQDIKNRNIKLKNIYLHKAASLIYNTDSYNIIKNNIQKDIELFKNINQELKNCDKLIKVQFNYNKDVFRYNGGSILYDDYRKNFINKLQYFENLLIDMTYQLDYYYKNPLTVGFNLPFKDFFNNFKNLHFQNLINSYYNKTKKYLTYKDIKQLTQISPAGNLDKIYEKIGGNTKKNKKIHGRGNEVFFLTDENDIKEYITDVLELNNKVFTETGQSDTDFLAFVENPDELERVFIKNLEYIINNLNLARIEKKPIRVKSSSNGNILLNETMEIDKKEFSILDLTKVIVKNVTISNPTYLQTRQGVTKVIISIVFHIQHINNLLEESIPLYKFVLTKYKDIYKSPYTYHDVIGINKSKITLINKHGLDVDSNIIYNFSIKHQHSYRFSDPNISNFRQNIKGVKFTGKTEKQISPYEQIVYKKTDSKSKRIPLKDNKKNEIYITDDENKNYSDKYSEILEEPVFTKTPRHYLKNSRRKISQIDQRIKNWYETY